MPADIWRPPLTATFSHDGSDVELIPLSPVHRAVLAESFQRLSERSRYLRFMAPISRLSSSELDHLTDLDVVNRFAWGLLVDGEPGAVGRYARAVGTTTAEIGVTVLDDHQRRGLGTLLVESLAVVGASVGITIFEFEVLAENAAMLTVLERMGASLKSDGAVVHGELAVANVPEPEMGSKLLLEVVETAPSA